MIQLTLVKGKAWESLSAHNQDTDFGSCASYINGIRHLS